jgi:hypothetical protein
MAIRGSVTLECDSKGCQAELVLGYLDLEVAPKSNGLELTAHAWWWVLDEDGLLHCPQCCEEDTRANDAHERAAARARNNDFEDTNGRDWT